MSGELRRIASIAVPAPPAPVLPAEPLERLPVVRGDTDPYWRLVTAFLVGYPPHSSRAYFSDLKAWYAWCAHAGVHPLAARRHHDVWVRHLSQAAQPATGRPASPASIARRLSCLSKFYDYGIKDAEPLEHSPVANVRRPKISDDSSTVGLTAEELDALLTAAEEHGPRLAALVSLLVYNGLRIAEVLACDVEHLTHQRGHRVLRIVRKGGRASTEPLAPIVLRALDAYVARAHQRPDLPQRQRHRPPQLLDRLQTRPPPGQAGGYRQRQQDQPAQPAPQLRHRAARRRRAIAGRPGRDGSRRPPHHRAYDRSRHNLDRHPTYTMAAQLHRTALPNEAKVDP